VAVYFKNPGTENISKAPSQIAGVWPHPQFLPTVLQPAVDSKWLCGELTINGGNQMKTDHSTIVAATNSLQSCKIHETYNDHD
jgi:hypothetical protein